MTSYLHHNTIPRGTRFSESLVKIRPDDVTWRHVTSFSHFFAKNCWKTADISKKDELCLIFFKEHYNNFHFRGQPLSYDKWFSNYRYCYSIRRSSFKVFSSKLEHRFSLPAFLKLLVNRHFLSDLLQICTHTQKYVENCGYIILGPYLVNLESYCKLKEGVRVFLDHPVYLMYISI